MKVASSTAMMTAAFSVAYAADTCDQWGQTKSGNYIIYNNLWGSSAATGGGKQCTGLDSGSGDTVAWHTVWSWMGGDTSVKSYANAALTFDAVPLTEVDSIPSSIEFKVKYSGKAVANVAYDLFTSSTAEGEKKFEIMIWMAAIGGAGPISSTGKPIDTAKIAGVEWSVFSGPNGQMVVYSFVASKPSNNFEGDLMEFFDYLAKSQKFKMRQYLIKVECGMEPFIGKDVSLTVSKYSTVVKTGKSGSSTSSDSSAKSDDDVTQTDPTSSSDNEVGGKAEAGDDLLSALGGTPSSDDKATKASPDDETAEPGADEKEEEKEEEETADLEPESSAGKEEPDSTSADVTSATIAIPTVKSKCILRRN
uniref:Uncharacterized protein n=1 Tax=Hyaloperonospora arabidopsidis (strain Emoy2) TaxID=559515 RepID=M4BGG1_HYAAE